MKLLFSILFVLCFIETQAQTYYSDITEKEYDSLEHIQYFGRIYFTNGTIREGWIRKTTEDGVVYYSLKKDGEVETYRALKVKGFYLISVIDTAYFTFLPISVENSNRKEMRALRILIHTDNPNKISLLRFAWLSQSTQKSWFKTKVYSHIFWQYYLWKEEKLFKINSAKDLKFLIKNDKDALLYFKQHKRDFESEDNYTILHNLIYIYNRDETNYKKN